jgi:hypothetical protein
VPKETADLAQLQGVWKSVALGPTHVDVVFSGDQFELKRYPKGAQPNEEFKPEVKGAFKLDMGLVAPQRFQIVDPKSGAVTHVGVYRLEGNKMDSLSLCYRPAGTEIEYPVFFATDPPTRTELLVLKRSAKAPADK